MIENNIRWIQNLETVSMIIPFKRSLKKNVTITVYKNFIQIYEKEKKIIKRIDLKDHVKLVEKCNFSLNGEKLKITLEKNEKKLWENFNCDITKEEIRRRRKEGILDRENYINKLNEIKKKENKKIYDKLNDKRFEIDQKERQEINKIKSNQKKKALEDIILDENENKDTNKLITKKEIEKIKMKSNLKNKHDQSIRKKQEKNIKLKFTKKVFANLAMREKYLYEAPRLKSKKKGEEGKVNFLWLHDKGNDFLKKRDYNSALRAYEEVIKVEPYLPTFSNISLVNLKLGNFEKCLADCQNFFNIFKNLDENSKNLTKNKKIILIIKKREIFVLLMLGRSEEALKKYKEFEPENKSDKLKKKNDLEILRKRFESNSNKKKGDFYLEKKNYQKSLENYKKALKIDQKNEKVISNITLLFMRQKRYKDALKNINKCLELIYIFGKEFDSNNYSDSFLKEFIIKQLMRKIECEEKLDKIKEIEKSIKILLKFDSKNKFGLKKNKNMIKKENLKKYFILKDNFKNCIKNSKFEKSLEELKDSKDLINIEDDPLEFLTIGLNRTVAYLKLNELSLILSECTKSLKQIYSLEKNILNQKVKKIIDNNKEKFKKIKIRYLLRRSNAYFKLNKNIEGNRDLKKISEIDSTYNFNKNK